MKRLIGMATAAILVACSGSDAPADEDMTNQPNTPAAAPGETSEPATTPDAPELRLPLPASTAPAITEADLGIRISTLADDTFEGRAPGTEAGEASADWVAAEMARIGLSPGGPDRSWFQTVEMVDQTLDTDASGLSISGLSADGPRALELGTEAVIWTKRQEDLELDFAGSEMVFVGYGVVAPEYDWNDYAGLDVDGKTVVMLVNDPGFATGDPELFNGKAMTYYGRWTYKYEEAARQGATAAIIIHETAPASYGWDVVSNSWSGAQADLVRADGGASRIPLEGWVTRDVAETLFGAAGLDLQAMKQAAQTPGFTPVDMGDLTASATIKQSVTRGISRNVIGMIKGTDRPDENVLYTAHWDHLGKKSGEKTGQPGEDFYEDQIYNGAVDNAAGMSGMLDIAEKAAAGPRPARSMLFLAVTLEESGLLGSAYYAENPTVPLGKIVAGMNIDGYLPVGRTQDMVVVGYGASQLEDRLSAILAKDHREIKPDPKPEAGYFYRSDHISLAKKGVPMLFADGGQDKLDGGIAAGRAAMDAYTARRYHKPMDEYSESWDLAGMVEDMQALYEVGHGLATSQSWPEWYEGNEFKAIREASRASAGGE